LSSPSIGEGTNPRWIATELGQIVVGEAAMGRQHVPEDGRGETGVESGCDLEKLVEVEAFGQNMYVTKSRASTRPKSASSFRAASSSSG
jgi:hypothetical protein